VRPAQAQPAPRVSKRRLLEMLLATGMVLGPAQLAGAGGEARAPEKPKKPTRREQEPRLDLFLLVGQSNMAGRGDIEAIDREPLDHVLALDAAGDWVPAVDPLHWDKPSAGVGLGRTFAQEYLRTHPGVTVGLIPAAVGGSPISSWQPGKLYEETHSHPYDDAIARARHALERGTLRAILWHQGESDRAPDLAPKYGAALTALIERFRRELHAPRVPFLIGQLGQFPGAGAWDEPTQSVDRAQREVAARVPYSAFVPSAGLTSKPDNLHFDARSLRELGKRYAAALAALGSPAVVR
jgi:carbohydrate esterase-like sialic acid-specific acetylesterase